MGCSSSRDLTPPKTPLEVIVYEETRQGQLERIQRKEEKQIQKLREKLERKRKKQLKKLRRGARRSTVSSRTRKITNATAAHRNEASKLKDLDTEIEEETQALINTDLCMFLLNQTALSMEFFGNFESESTAILADFLNKENEFNKNLNDQSILLGNPMDAAVHKWLKFKPIHGPDKNHIQPLQAPVIYVVFENIDISRPDDSDYDSIPPLCNVIMETKSYRTTPCKEELIEVLRQLQWKGYVRLRLRDDPARQAVEAASKEKFQATSKGTSSKGIYIQGSSGYGTEQDYDYVYITKLNTQKPLKELKMDDSKKLHQLGTDVFPDSCVSYLGDYLHAQLMEDSDDDMHEFKEFGDNKLDIDVEKQGKHFRNMETLQAIRRYKLEVERRQKLLQQRYINSQHFMSFFAELLRRSLAKQLSIADDDLANSKYRGASIYTKDYEIIPAIHVAQNAQHWPECTAQFRLRERPVRVHPRSGESVQWPTRAMIKQIETFGYHVIPLGYAPKRRKNPFRELEWRIVFPKAERYLERHLSYTQVKILLIMKILIKTFIEPKEPGKCLIFVMELLRTHLFWECERNFTNWPEEFLGDVLLRFISTFKMSLKQKRLRDYFVQERNLLEAVPEQSIMTLVSTLADIASNPLMHCLVAFRNLVYNEKFFPKLDLRRIFRNLTAENSIQLKQLSKNSNFFADSDGGSDGLDFEMLDADPDDLIGSRQHTETAPEKFSKRACQLLYEMEKAKREKKRRRGSVESVQVEFFFNNNLPEHSTYESVNVAVEFLRRSNILEVLMDHFLAVLRRAIKFRNLKLSRALLVQLQRFGKYYRSYGTDFLAKDYENSIQLLEDALQELQSSYGHLGFEQNDDEKYDEEVEQTNVQKKDIEIKLTTEVNPYEEVMPMQENLPTIQKALKLWESRLQKKAKHAESARSSKSTRGSHMSTNVKEIQVEVYCAKKKIRREKNEDENEHAENLKSTPSKHENKFPNGDIAISKIKFDSAGERKLSISSMDQSLHRRQYKMKSKSSLNSSDESCAHKRNDKPKTFGAHKVVQEGFSSAYETQSDSSHTKNTDSHTGKLKNGSKTKKKEHRSDVSENGTMTEASDAKRTKTKSRRNLENTNNMKENKKENKKQKEQALRIGNNSKDYTKCTANTSTKAISANQGNIERKSKKSSTFEAEGLEDLDNRIAEAKKKRQPRSEPKFSSAYDNAAYSTDSTEEIHESFNRSLKILASAEGNDGTWSVRKSTRPRKTSVEFLPRYSIRSQNSFKENRRITYDTDDDEEINTLHQSQSEVETENFEFKCLEDLSISALEEFETFDTQIANKNDLRELELTELFAFNIIDEKHSNGSVQETASKRTSNANGKSCSKQENGQDNELKDLSNKSKLDVKQAEGEAKKSLFSKYINRETVLKNFTIISPDMIDTLAESKQKIKDTFCEEKRARVLSVLKKRTLQFKKAALN